MNQIKVLVIDAGLGNIGSIMNALARLDCNVEKHQNPPSLDSVNSFTHLILPGVGAFRAGMESLTEKKWDKWITKNWCSQNKPLLGICLGMQLLASYGEEGSKGSNFTKGLDLIKGDVMYMKNNQNLLLPHVGWNTVNWTNNSKQLSNKLPLKSDFYFVHSYEFKVKETKNILGNCYYGKDFASVVASGNCFGVQFHPEKSQGLGKQLLNNFLRV